MIALQITSMKNFMTRLLASEVFDCFLLEETVISTANTFTIDGRINREFFAGDSVEAAGTALPAPGASRAGGAEEFRPWGELRGLCFDLIKGKRTPLSFRFVLHLMPEKASALLTGESCDADPAQIKALVLNIRYDGAKTVLTTGVSLHAFLLSKEPDAIWDKALMKYLDSRGIEYEIL